MQKWLVYSRNAILTRPGHPCHGHSVLGSMAATLTAFGKTLSPYQKNVTNSIATATTAVSASVAEAVNVITDPAQQELLASINC